MPQGTALYQWLGEPSVQTSQFPYWAWITHRGVLHCHQAPLQEKAPGVHSGDYPDYTPPWPCLTIPSPTSDSRLHLHVDTYPPVLALYYPSRMDQVARKVTP